MATQFGDTKRTLSTGDLVVSVSEIFDRLQTKVDPTTLEQLLRDILAGRRNQVRPGELITAELINQILAELESLQVRVTKLEATGPVTPGPGIGTGTPVITQLIPPEGQPVRVGEELQVIGQNFGISSLTNSVLIDAVRVTSFKSATDTRLVFDIPTLITDVPSGGRPATLTVRNDTRSAQKPLSLQSAMTLAGPVDVILVEIQPGTLTANNPATFRFRLHSRANLDAVYTIAPVIGVGANQAAWQSNVQVLNEAGAINTNRTIQLNAGGEQNFIVRINPIPPGTDGTAFTLTVGATAPGSTGTSGPIGATVGAAAESPDPAITALTFASGQVLGPGTGGSVNANTIRVPTTRGARVVLFAEFSEVATYQVSVALVSPANNWQTQLLTPPNTTSPPNTFQIATTDLQSGGGRVPRFPEFSIAPTTDATQGRVEVRIQRIGATRSRTFRMNLEIGS